jgi:hypothetical protein
MGAAYPQVLLVDHGLRGLAASFVRSFSIDRPDFNDHDADVRIDPRRGHLG